MLTGVERSEQRLAHVEFFGQALPRAGVAQFRNVLHVLHPAWQVMQERAGNVLFGNGVVRKRRPVVGLQLLPDVIARLVGRRRLLRFGIAAQRLLRVLPEFSVDLARREMGASEQYLKADAERRGLLR